VRGEGDGEGREGWREMENGVRSRRLGWTGFQGKKQH
jgi:hypothetical protein